LVAVFVKATLTVALETPEFFDDTMAENVTGPTSGRALSVVIVMAKGPAFCSTPRMAGVDATDDELAASPAAGEAAVGSADSPELPLHPEISKPARISGA